MSEGEERAPTAGSRFLEESVELYAQQNTSALFTKYMDQLDIIFAHAEKDQAGKSREGGGWGALEYGADSSLRICSVLLARGRLVIE